MTDEEFLRSLVFGVARRGQVYVRPALGEASKTLLDAMRTEPRQAPKGQVKVALHVPHYWAYHVHQGRRAPLVREDPVMVWFRNPLDDPRLINGKTPERASELRKLSRSDFLLWADRNREARARGLPEPMVVRRTVRKPTRPKPFFSTAPDGGMAGFERSIEPYVRRRVKQHFAGKIKELAKGLDGEELRFSF